MADDYHDAMKTAMKFKSGLPVAEDLHHEELKHLTFQKKEFLSMLARMNWLNMLNMPVYLPAQADRSYPFFKAVEFLQKDLLSKEKLHRKALADQQNEYEQLLTQKTILLNAQIELNNKTSLLFEEEKQALNATMAEKKLELEQMSAAIAETSAKLSELCSYLHSLDIDEFQKNRLIEACSGIIENETIEKKLKIELTTADTAFVSMLQKMHPNLNQRELRIGLLVKLNYDNKKIARSVGISTRGIESIRYRMHKKLGLDKHRSIKTYFTELTSVRQ
jgi:DNA-binding CsgD family transcriptional regulator